MLMEAFFGGLLGGIVGLFGMGIGLGINQRLLAQRQSKQIDAAAERAQALLLNFIATGGTSPSDTSEVN